MVNRSSYAARGARSIPAEVNKGGTGHRVFVLAAYDALSPTEDDCKRVYSQRAGTAAEECSVLSWGGPGGAGAAAALRVSFSRRRRRFAALRRYRDQLASTWRLRHYQFRAGRAHLLPPDPILRGSRGDIQPHPGA